MPNHLRNLVKIFSLPPGVVSFSQLVARVKSPDTNNPAHLYLKDGKLISPLGISAVSQIGRLDVWVLSRSDYLVQLVDKGQTFVYQEFRLPPNGESDVSIGGVTPGSLLSSDSDNSLTLGTDGRFFVRQAPQLSSANW